MLVVPKQQQPNPTGMEAQSSSMKRSKGLRFPLVCHPVPLSQKQLARGNSTVGLCKACLQLCLTDMQAWISDFLDWQIPWEGGVGSRQVRPAQPQLPGKSLSLCFGTPENQKATTDFMSKNRGQLLSFGCYLSGHRRGRGCRWPPSTAAYSPPCFVVGGTMEAEVRREAT